MKAPRIVVAVAAAAVTAVVVVAISSQAAPTSAVRFPAGFSTPIWVGETQVWPTLPPSTTTTVRPTTTIAATTTTIQSTTTTAASTTTTTPAVSTTAPTTTVAPTTTPATLPSGGSACGLVNAVFCETFDAPAGDGGKTGDLNPELWGVSRTGYAMNAGQGQYNTTAYTSMSGCGTTAWVAPPADVRICNGKMFESQNDAGGVVALTAYPKQPFDFAGRTGKVVFDVSADSEGTHAAWPEFTITDKPVPGVHGNATGTIPPVAANEVGFTLTACGDPTMTNVGRFYVSKNNLYSEPVFTQVACITKGNPNALNHIEVRVSQNRIEVWGTDAGSSTLKLVAFADNIGLTFTKGLVWLDDVHYNARKSIEPCECGTQFNHTFVWDNLAFDGPVTYRDLGFNAPDAATDRGLSPYGDQTVNLGYSLGSPLTLTVPGVYRRQTPTGALVVFNIFTGVGVLPSVSVNGNPPIANPWIYDPPDGNRWVAVATVVPLDQVHDGSNTLRFVSSDGGSILFNATIILVAGAAVP